MIQSTIKTEIRVSCNGYEVWCSFDGGQSSQFHGLYTTMEDAVRETIILKGHFKLLGDLKTAKQ